MLLRIKHRRLVLGIATFLIAALSISLVSVNLVKAQTGEFIGTYDYTLFLEGMELSGEMEMYQYQLNDTIETYFGTYNPTTVTHRPDYRLESSSSGYIDISDQNSYTNVEGNLVKSETTFSLHLSGYQQVTYTATYEYGFYHTITNNATLFEETYTERYYEDGAFVESMDYHDYTYLYTQDDVPFTENITVDAGEFECLILIVWSFQGISTDIKNIDDWQYYRGGPIIWIDVEEGHLVKQEQYDEYDVTAEINLKSLEDPRAPPGGEIDSTLLVVGGGAGAAVIIVAAVVRSRRGGSSDYHDASPVVWN